ncbi:hypothetical protein T492DRAFT_1035646 [Pavlovales sp. CCMP2436]|nr:hypothetical protein T492DRAFT_1035646 [Pavlovales sp. CCMP2436]
MAWWIAMYSACTRRRRPSPPLRPRAIMWRSRWPSRWCLGGIAVASCGVCKWFLCGVHLVLYPRSVFLQLEAHKVQQYSWCWAFGYQLFTTIPIVAICYHIESFLVGFKVQMIVNIRGVRVNEMALYFKLSSELI